MYFHLLIDVSANILVVNQPLYHYVFSLHQPGCLELSDFCLLMLLMESKSISHHRDVSLIELDSLASSGVLTNLLVWSVVTSTSDLSLLRLF